MIAATLKWVSDVLNRPFENYGSAGRTVDMEQQVVGITTDSRNIVSGEVFLALKGPNFDAHKFIAEVKTKGAIAAVVEQADTTVDLPQIVVPNTLRALGLLGAAVAKTVNAKTIAITGSVGKTSVKEMCAEILKQKGEVLATAGNFNNEIGVPLTLLRLEPKHQFAVVELGANHLGEIAYTTRLASPDVAILNNVAEAHLEGFGDLNGVATAKSEIFEGLKSGGTAVFDRHSDYRSQWLSKLEQQFAETPGQVVEFNANDETAEENQFSASDITLDERGCAKFVMHFEQHKLAITLNVPGKHNVANALAAAAACYQIGATLQQIAAGLNAAKSVKGRVNLHPVNDQVLIIDDTYNANVQSVKAAIDLLQSYQGLRILVLGDMAELGADARRLHQEVGVYGVQQGIDKLFSFGVLSQNTSTEFERNGAHYSSQAQLIKDIHVVIASAGNEVNKQPVVVLVKGSRSAKMELVVEELIKQIEFSVNDDNDKNNNKNSKGTASC